MTREGLADRLVNYADAAAAFSVVNSIAFLFGLTETEVRCSLAPVASLVVIGQITVVLVTTLGVVALRRFELRLRAADAPAPADVRSVLRGFYIARLGVIWVSMVATLALARLALSDPGCSALVE